MNHLADSKKTQKNQLGMASIIVTMIIMIVISLIVIAAALLSRRGQRQTLDRQLSTQAFYAAESGVNDAVKAIQTELGAGGTTLTGTDRTTDCVAFIGATTPALNPNLGGNVKYSCLLVDPTPTTWEGNVGDTSRVTPIIDANGGTIASVTIAWQAKDEGTSPDFTICTNQFNPVGSRPCKTPILRFDLVPTATANRNALNSNVMTGFLIPVSPGGGATTTIVYAPTPYGLKQTIICSSATTPKYCKATITGLSGASYSLRMKTIYGSASVTVSASGNPLDPTAKLQLKDSQIVIDSTGKAADILRRIQVRVPFIGAINFPEFAIQSGDTICKQLTISGANASTIGNPACQP